MNYRVLSGFQCVDICIGVSNLENIYTIFAEHIKYIRISGEGKGENCLYEAPHKVDI